MFTEILGTMIGFVTIVLLLSILVTAVVQTVTSFLKDRHKALERGLTDSAIESTLTAVTSGFLIETDNEKKATEAFGKAVADAKTAATGNEVVKTATKAIDHLPATSSLKVLGNYLAEITKDAKDAQHAAEVLKLFESTANALKGPADTSGFDSPKQLAEKLVSGTSDARLKQLPDLVDKAITKIKSGSDANILLDLVKRTVANASTDNRVTWIEDKEVVDPLKIAGVSATGVEAVRHALDHTRQVMDTHFLRWTRGYTFIAAVFVAFIFQASVPDVLTKLQSDKALRDAAVEMGTKLEKQHEEAEKKAPAGQVQTAAPKKPEDKSDKPDAATNPDAAAKSTESTKPAEAPKPAEPPKPEPPKPEPPKPEPPKPEPLKPEPPKIDVPAQPDVPSNDEILADLARLGIKPLQDFSFYRSAKVGKDGKPGAVETHWNNIIGVLFMSVLLSFGAPFWYRMLKELIGLKDALRKKEDKADPAESGDKSGKGAKA